MNTPKSTRTQDIKDIMSQRTNAGEAIVRQLMTGGGAAAGEATVRVGAHLLTVVRLVRALINVCNSTKDPKNATTEVINSILKEYKTRHQATYPHTNSPQTAHSQGWSSHRCNHHHC